MDINYIKASIEGILFASGEPVEISRLCETFDLNADTMEAIISNMLDTYNEPLRGIRLLRLENSLQLCTREDFADDIRHALAMRKNAPLSSAALEILAIVAYNQPVTRVYIEQVRGVECSYTINSLIEKGLIEEAGRLDAPGRPLLYRTTSEFLRIFGLSSLKDLPPLPDTQRPRLESEDGTVDDVFGVTAMPQTYADENAEALFDDSHKPSSYEADSAEDGGANYSRITGDAAVDALISGMDGRSIDVEN